MDTQEDVRYVCMLSGEWSSLYMIEEECVIRTNPAGPFWGRCIQDCSRALYDSAKRCVRVCTLHIFEIGRVYLYAVNLAGWFFASRGAQYLQEAAQMAPEAVLREIERGVEFIAKYYSHDTYKLLCRIAPIGSSGSGDVRFMRAELCRRLTLEELSTAVANWDPMAAPEKAGSLDSKIRACIVRPTGRRRPARLRDYLD